MPLAPALHAVPLFDITVNERLVFAGAFALAMLAALAVDAWPTATGRARAAATLVLAVLLILGLGTAWLRGAPGAARMRPDLVRMLVLAELLPLAGLVLVLIGEMPRALARTIVLGLVLLQRTVVDGTIYPSLPPSAFYPRIPLLDHLQDDRGEPFRIVGLDQAFRPDAAALYGLEDARGYEAMTFRRLDQTYRLWSVPLPVWFNMVSDLSRPFLSFLNVKYAIAGPDARPDGQWRLVREDRGSRLLENTRVVPRAFVPARVRLEPEALAIFQAMSTAADFSQTAWILAPGQPSVDLVNGPGTLRIRRDGAGLDVDATMERPGWVVVSEAGWRGWRATIDGRRVPLHDANHAFLGVHVPEGRHRLQLVYRPESLTLGLTVSLITFAASIAACVAWSLRRRRGKARAS
jgi:hypothetical protein